MGRPSKFNNALAERICGRIVGGESLRAICADAGYPHMVTVLRWLEKREAFRNQYAQARAQGLDAMAEDILHIANTPQLGVVVQETKDGTFEKRGDMIEHRRLQVDARKWLLSKLAPKKYGDRLDVDAKVDAAINVTIKHF